MSGIEDHLVREGIHPLFDVFHELFEGFGAAGSSRPPRKYGVSQNAMAGHQKGRAGGRVARSGQERLDFALSEFDFVPVVDVEVRLDPELFRLCGGNADRRARRFPQRVQRLNVVGVAVRHQDGADVRPFRGGQDLLRLKGGVHDDAVVCLLADQDIDVIGEISNRDLLDQNRASIRRFHVIEFSTRGFVGSLERRRLTKC